MIRVDRGTEPPALQASRRTKLAAAALMIQTGQDPRSLTDDGYDCAKATLFRAQHRKCAYCERRCGLVGQPTEHFRPKKVAWRGTPESKLVDTDRYWWLAWTWENLLFACVSCNSTANKGNWFPLEPGTNPLPVPWLVAAPDGSLTLTLDPTAFDLSLERPLLVDPCVEDPLDHLRWRPREATLTWEQWRWVLDHSTPAGRTTIDRVGLRALEDDVNDHWTANVLPSLRNVVSASSDATALQAWNSQVLPKLASTSDHAGATWSIVHHLHAHLDLGSRGIPAPARP